MFRLYANAAQTEAIKSAALFLVVVRRDTRYGVSPVDLKVVPATKIDTLRTIPTGRSWYSRERVVAPSPAVTQKLRHAEKSQNKFAK